MEKQKYIITPDDFRKSREFLLEEWGKDAHRVIDLCAESKPFGGNCSDFLDHCIACGGDWCGMYLTGIRELYPEVYEAIPNDMGESAFVCIAKVLMLLGVDTAN